MFFTLLFSFSGSAQTLLLTEDFETDGEGVRYTSNSFPSGTGCSDYFIRYQDGAAQCVTTDPTGESGTFYWMGEDVDDAGNPAPPDGILTLNSVVITSYNPEIRVLLALGRATGDRFEATDALFFEYNIDGGGWNVCGAFYGGFGGPSSDLVEDTDLDGTPDGAALTGNFTEYIFAVPATGTNMQVRFRMAHNAGTEEVGVDNIRIFGTTAANPEIDIEGLGVSIADGDLVPTTTDDTDFGTLASGSTDSHTFTIQNEGTSDLTLTDAGPNYVGISGSSAFSITTQPTSGTIGASGSETFVVQFAPDCTHSGTVTADITVNNDDADESAYTFRVQGTVSHQDSDGDGISDITDIDDDNDGLTDVTEGGGTDPSGDADADCDFNYLDPDFPGFVDANSDLINDNFDFDLDGIPNHLDVDSDGDGIVDAIECNGGSVPASFDNATGQFTGAVGANGMPDNSETVPESGVSILSCLDSDGDGLDDRVDIDSDGDGISDNIECQGTVGYTLPSGTDADSNGRDDVYDGAGALTPNNHDGADNPDFLDTDTDNDGVLDRIEGHDSNQDGYGAWDANTNQLVDDAGTATDTDGDGLMDAFDLDNASLDPTSAATTPPGGSPGTNAELQDTDGADDLDWRDDNDDNDGTVTGTGAAGSGEDYNADGDWANDFTEGGSSPDYLWATEIDIEGNSTSIADGDVTPDLADDTDFGSVAFGANVTNTFTIQNEGISDLTLSGGPTYVTISGGGGRFSVTSQPASGTISSGGSETFQITFDGSTCPITVNGTFTATVSVSSDDTDESPYTFDIEATSTGIDTDSDGEYNGCDADDDNDGILDGADPDDADFNVCGDSDADGCDDCSITNDGFGPLSDSDPNNDGPDADCDGICDVTDPVNNAAPWRGNMLAFDGGSDFISLGNAAELDFGSGSTFTIEAWINTAVGGDADIISKYGGLFSAGWVFQHSTTNTSIAFYMQGGFLDAIFAGPAGAPAVADGAWHHVAVTYDGSNSAAGFTFYVDGVSYAGVALGGLGGPIVGPVPNGNNAAIGAYEMGGPAEYWNGQLEEVRVWDDIRTQTEIREHIHLSINGTCDVSNVGYWKFNDAAGPTATDVSGYGNNGTLMGPQTYQPSTASVGAGVSTTHSMTATATPYTSPSVTAGVSMDLTFATVPPGGEVVVTNIYGKPVNGVPGQPNVADHSWHYWVVNNYGPTQVGLDATATFDHVDGGVTDVTLANYSLYKRGSREFGAWIENNSFASAASTVPGNNYIEFTPITDFSQLFPIAKNPSSSPLPVDFLNFDVEKVDEVHVFLDWTTATETNNKGFNVQRSMDGDEWVNIAFVKGAGTRTTATDYELMDYEPLSGWNYYRLEQVDQNGLVSTYSEIKSVWIEQGLAGDVMLHPNPNTGQFTLTFTETSTDMALVDVIDPLGRVIANYQMNARQKQFTLNNEVKGIYFVRVRRSGKEQLLRMVVR